MINRGQVSLAVFTHDTVFTTTLDGRYECVSQSFPDTRVSLLPRVASYSCATCLRTHYRRE